MLTRLELIGFKSFADKTRFDFAPGVTAVVGPNGSGKSNVVDAVKWVLGEQSAKALRGGEMADVIFNGSSTRKALGLAEVTLSFDNRPRAMGESVRRPLDTAADEVQVTRRVYRDGQGEYLINGQLARLRDVRDLFLGSGAGNGAYSVIEQGRVDALLTASTADRRAVFEEAAGISRFKARKVETLRKLERVDADLTRVRDILQELDKQLRTLRLQASKAQRYQEYAARLRDLRVGLAVREFRELADTLDREGRVLTDLRAAVSGVAEKEKTGEDQARRLDDTLAAVEGELRTHEAALGRARQEIAGNEAAAKAERPTVERAEADLLRLGKQRVDLGHRTRRVHDDLARTADDLAVVERAAADEQARASAAAAALAGVTARIASLLKNTQADRNRLVELAKEASRLQNEVVTRSRDADRSRRDLTAKRHELDRTTQRHDALAAVLEDLSKNDADLQQQLAGAKQNLAEHLTYRDELRRNADALQADLDADREARSALRGRADVLVGLEQSLDGLGAGVRAVLGRLAANDPQLAAVAGLVADLITAPRDVAPLIDLALGDAAQRFVVTDPAAVDEITAALSDVPGRVGLTPLSPGHESPRTGIDVWSDSPDTAGVVSAADLVAVERPDLAALPRHLLGHVAVVPDLVAARQWAKTHPRHRFVTRAGEVLDPDGTLTIGPVGGGAGILSRKSELRDLREQIRGYDERVQERETRQAAFRRQADAMDAPVQALETEIAALSGQAGTLQSRIREQRQKQEQLAELIELARGEVGRIEAEVRAVEDDLRVKQDEWAASEKAERELKAGLAAAEEELTVAQRDRDQRQVEDTAAQVSLSRVMAQLTSVRKKREELENEANLRRLDAVNLASSERSARGRLAESTLLVLRHTAAAAGEYAAKDAAERAVAVLSADRDRLRADLDAVQAGLRRFRQAWTDQRDRAHAHEMIVHDLTLRRDTLTARIRDDFGVELADLAAAPPPVAAGTDADPIPLTHAPEPEQVQEEIDELKRKIAKLGSVNMEAIAELADVEKRETDLRTQHDDLTDSQAKLVEIIERINTDSRKLFVETLTTVRGHFQELFRKLFGGGMADVVLEDETDPLESGIDVTARPPGKELRSISLLSGGERTLTAVALLLAIFRSRPSPFCILDEVDAALDEANTARLAALVREFLDRSQFIVVTHKKRTMAMADVIYGVTMQESGVSKQVSVRFEDWPEDESQQAA
jgi:chromosome segregation protein